MEAAKTYCTASEEIAKVEGMKEVKQDVFRKIHILRFFEPVCLTGAGLVYVKLATKKEWMLRQSQAPVNAVT